MTKQEHLLRLRNEYKLASEARKLEIIEEAKIIKGECTYPTCKENAQEDLTTCVEHTPTYKAKLDISAEELKKRTLELGKNAPAYIPPTESLSDLVQNNLF